MSDQQNLFNDNQQTPAQQPVEQPVTPNPAPAAPIDPFTQMLANIKADDGRQKYNSVPDALNALDHSQKYIAQLQAQIKELEVKAAQNVTMEQVLERINQPKEQNQPQQAGLTPDDVMAILQQQEAKKKVEDNAATFVSKFKEIYGDKAQEVFYGKAAEMGLNSQQIESLVASSPQAVFTMFGITNTAPTPSAPMPNGINTTAMVTPAAPEIKTAMGFVTERQLVDSWKQIKDAVNAQYGIKN